MAVVGLNPTGVTKKRGYHIDNLFFYLVFTPFEIVLYKKRFEGIRRVGFIKCIQKDYSMSLKLEIVSFIVTNTK